MWKKILISVAMVMAILIFFAFYRIDKLVTNKLHNAENYGFSAIYTSELIINENSIIAPSNFEQILFDRNYQSTTEQLTPGRYQKIDTQFKIYRREYKSGSKTLPPKVFSFETTTGKIVSNGKEEIYIDLEPIVLAPLIGNDQTESKPKQLKDIPKNMKEAVLAVEDRRFYSHFGLDIIGILRAMYTNVVSGDLVQGGSSITQQLAKNLFFSNRRSLKRKLMEIPASISLEYHLEKDQILEMYLNQVYLGQEGATALHGVAVATQAFFGKDLKDISLSEAALIAGIIRAPSRYAPHKNLKLAKSRRDTALSLMLEQKRITQVEYDKAFKEPIKLTKKFNFNRRAPFFIDQIRKRIFNLDSDIIEPVGLKVQTGMDLGIQNCAENALRNSLNKLSPKGGLEGGLVAIEPSTGLIKAYVGGRDYSKRQFDHAVQAQRQIGSTVKPFIYLTALDEDLNSYKVATAQSTLFDEPISIDLGNDAYWTPDNYDHEYHGKVSLRYALEHSLNIPAAYIGYKVGAEAMAKTLTSFKIADDILPTPSLALGALDTNLLRLVSAYGALANGGKYLSPRFFTQVSDTENNTLLVDKQEEKQISNKNVIYVLTDILKGVLSKGTASVVRQAGFTRQAAGKTGTSNETRDAWFVAYTPSLVAGVWVGYDDNRETGFTGGRVAAPIWTDFMKCAQPYYTDENFKIPDGVKYVTIDQDTGDLASEECSPSRQISELYVSGTEPTEKCRANEEVIKPEVLPELERPAIDNKRRETNEDPSFWDNLFN